MNKLITAIAPTRALSVGKQALCIAAVAASLSIFSLSASAQAAPPQLSVDFDDLDLSKDRDMQRLYSRLRTAASEVCAEFRDHAGTRMRAQKQQCKTNALNGAIATIGNASLTALHSKRIEEKLAQSRPKSAPAG